MLDLFPITEVYFQNFYNQRLEMYKTFEDDFHPTRHPVYRYSKVKESHRFAIHEVMYELAGRLGNKIDLRNLKVPERFVTPQEVVKAILAYKDSLLEDKVLLEKYALEYMEDPLLINAVPYPLRTAIQKLEELIEMLSFALKQDEITPYLKEEFFNIHVGIPFYRENYYGFTKKDITKVFAALHSQKEAVYIHGQKINLKETESLLIFNNSLAPNHLKKGELQAYIHKTEKTLKTKSKLEILRHFGINVSEEFDIPEPLEKEMEQTNLSARKNPKPANNKRIFISHSSKDMELVTSFVEKVLILGMGVNRNNIFYTSGVGTGIKSGEDFRKRIAEEMKNTRAVIQILTPNYKSSEACLNEMGAAWVISDLVIPLLGPPYNYDTGFLHASDQQLKLNDKSALFSMYDDYKDKLFLTKQKLAVVHRQIEEFVAAIEESIKKD